MDHESPASETAETIQHPELLENQFKRVTVLYHGTLNENSKKESLQLFGLFSKGDRSTISADLGTAGIYGYSEGHNLLLTIWYPQKQDVTRQPPDKNRDVPVPDFAYLKRRLAPEEKGNISSQIEDSQIPEHEKEIIKQTLVQSKLILAPDRLGAVISFSDRMVIIEFGNLIEGSGFELFTKNRDKLKASALRVLKQAKIEYMRSGLTPEVLADDMVTSGIEYQLISAGYYLQDLKRKDYGSINEYWRDWRSKLESVTFAEPVYERYRQMLLNKFYRMLGKAPRIF